MKKQKSTKIFMCKEISSSDDESQAKPHKGDLKKYIKDSDEESPDQLTPKSSPQKPKVKRKKMLKKVSPTIQTNKTISQKISQKNLIPESELRKLRKKLQYLALIHLTIPKEKITNMWLNTMTKRFILVLQKLMTT